MNAERIAELRAVSPASSGGMIAFAAIASEWHKMLDEIDRRGRLIELAHAWEPSDLYRVRGFCSQRCCGDGAYGQFTSRAAHAAHVAAILDGGTK